MNALPFRRRRRIAVFPVEKKEKPLTVWVRVPRAALHTERVGPAEHVAGRVDAEGRVVLERHGPQGITVNEVQLASITREQRVVPAATGYVCRDTSGYVLILMLRAAAFDPTHAIHAPLGDSAGWPAFWSTRRNPRSAERGDDGAAGLEFDCEKCLPIRRQ